MISVGAQLGRSLYDPDDPLAERRPLDDQCWTLDHLEVKLFRLADGMLTKTGRALAEERIEWMRAFRDRVIAGA